MLTPASDDGLLIADDEQMTQVGRTLRRLGVFVALVSFGLTVVAAVLFLMNDKSMAVSFDWFVAHLSFTLSALTVPLAGALIIVRRPANTIGWFVLAIGGISSFTLFSIEYTARDIEMASKNLPLGQWAGCVIIWTIPLGLGWLAIFPLLFPNGRLPGTRWRPILWIVLVATLALAFSEGLLARPLPRGAADGIMNPIGIWSLNPYLQPLRYISFVLLVVGIVLGLCSLAYRMARSQGDERQQLKWVALSAALMVPTLLFALLTTTREELGGWVPVPVDFWRWEPLAWLLLSLALLTLPVTIAIAILKYRLYEIDYVLNRAIVYGSLTALLAGLYTASIPLFRLLFEDATGFVSEAGLVTTTLIFGAAFTPVRSKLQAFVDKHFGAPPSRLLVSHNERLRSMIQALSPEDNAEEFMVQSVEALNAKGAAIYLYAQGNAVLTAQTNGWTGEESVRIPMRYGGEDVGYLVLALPRIRRAYSRGDLETLQSSADLVARAITISKARPIQTSIAEAKDGNRRRWRRRPGAERSAEASSRRRRN